MAKYANSEQLGNTESFYNDKLTKLKSVIPNYYSISFLWEKWQSLYYVSFLYSDNSFKFFWKNKEVNISWVESDEKDKLWSHGQSTTLSNKCHKANYFTKTEKQCVWIDKGKKINSEAFQIALIANLFFWPQKLVDCYIAFIFQMNRMILRIKSLYVWIA